MCKESVFLQGLCALWALFNHVKNVLQNRKSCTVWITMFAAVWERSCCRAAWFLCWFNSLSFSAAVLGSYWWRVRPTGTKKANTSRHILPSSGSIPLKQKQLLQYSLSLCVPQHFPKILARKALRYLKTETAQQNCSNLDVLQEVSGPNSASRAGWAGVRTVPSLPSPATFYQ